MIAGLIGIVTGLANHASEMSIITINQSLVSRGWSAQKLCRLVVQFFCAHVILMDPRLFKIIPCADHEVCG